MNFVTISNHPVHIVDENGKIVSPTALIPFCEFGGNMSIMGGKIDNFDVPFCNSFRAKILGGQLCYEVDPNKFKKYLRSKDKVGLALYINFNKERKVSLKDLYDLKTNDSF